MKKLSKGQMKMIEPMLFGLSSKERSEFIKKTTKTYNKLISDHKKELAQIDQDFKVNYK